VTARRQRQDHVDHRQPGAEEQHAVVAADRRELMRAPRVAQVTRRAGGQPVRQRISRQRVPRSEHNFVGGQRSAAVEHDREPGVQGCHVADFRRRLSREHSAADAAREGVQGVFQVVAVHAASDEIRRLGVTAARSAPTHEMRGVATEQTHALRARVQQVRGIGGAVRDAAPESRAGLEQRNALVAAASQQLRR